MEYLTGLCKHVAECDNSVQHSANGPTKPVLVSLALVQQLIHSQQCGAWYAY